MREGGRKEGREEGKEGGREGGFGYIGEDEWVVFGRAKSIC